MEYKRADKNQAATQAVTEMNKIIEQEKEQDCIPLKELEPIGDMDFFDNIDEDVDVSDPTPRIESINKLTSEDMKEIVKSLKPELIKIFSGKRHSDRHEKFKEGGKEKRYLGYGHTAPIFSQEQELMALEALHGLKIFSAPKYFDYLIKVLHPETLTLILAKLENLTYEEALTMLTKEYN